MSKQTIGIVAIADTHLKTNDPLGTGRGIENTRTQKKFDVIRAAATSAIKMETDERILIMLGDIFDSPRIDEGIREAYMTIVARAVREGVRVLHIMGNHPTVGGSCPLRSEERLAEGFSFNVVSGSADLFTPFGEHCSKEWSIGLVPFMSDEKVEFVLKNMVNTPKTVLFGHFGLRAAFMTADFPAKNGVNPLLLSPFASVFLGDYHLRQTVLNPRHTGYNVPISGDEFYGYVGSSSAVDFGEEDYVHGFVKITLGDELEYEFVEGNTGGIRVLDLDLADPGGMTDLNIVRPGDLVKLRITGTIEQLKDYPLEDELKTLQRDLQPQFIRVETKVVQPDLPCIKFVGSEESPMFLIKQCAGDDEELAMIGYELFRAEK